MIVLVVEDEAFNRTYLKNLLDGIPDVEDVWFAEDGYDAVQKAASWDQTPSLVLIDIDMPRMDGLTFLEKLRRGEIENLRFDVPAYMLTSKDEPIFKETAERRNVDGYLVKPVSRDALIQALDEAKGSLTT